MDTLASRSIISAPFEEILSNIYPKDILNLSYEKYIKMNTKKLRDRFLPGTHLVPYGNRVMLAKSFISRLNPELAATNNIFLVLEFILIIIITRGRLIQIENNAYLWHIGKDGEFIVYTPTSKDTFHNLETTLQVILKSIGTIKIVDYHVFPPSHQEILEMMATTYSDEIKDIIEYLMENDDYEIRYKAEEFSFYPLNHIVSGWVILTKHGLYIIGDEKGKKLWSAFHLGDIQLVLAVEALNIDHTTLVEED